MSRPGLARALVASSATVPSRVPAGSTSSSRSVAVSGTAGASVSPRSATASASCSAMVGASGTVNVSPSSPVGVGTTGRVGLGLRAVIAENSADERVEAEFGGGEAGEDEADDAAGDDVGDAEERREREGHGAENGRILPPVTASSTPPGATSTPAGAWLDDLRRGHDGGARSIRRRSPAYGSRVVGTDPTAPGRFDRLAMPSSRRSARASSGMSAGPVTAAPARGRGSTRGRRRRVCRPAMPSG